MKNVTLQQVSKTYPSAATPAPVVAVRSGQVVVSSLDVAAFFDKRHDSVIRSIRTLDCSPVFIDHNFVFSKYRAPGSRRSYTFCEMTREGFTRLVSNFDGPEATRFIETYINEFSRMEATLKAAPPPAFTLPDFTDPATAARAWADQYSRAQVAESVVNRLAAYPDALGIQEAAKALKVAPRAFGQTLRAWRWLSNRTDRPVANEPAIRRGWLVQDKYTDPDGNERMTAKITISGLAEAAKLLDAQRIQPRLFAAD